ncbi:MAG: response regulator [Bacteroidia bacterium]|jgi:CheY-like chemotaxis protein|nr:response regulator [Bacteroidota bacterium]MBL7948425.1 response regulator [Bacteroidia bacterium]MBP7269016.1 response regulator [Bacteroidia bacterium]MBP7437306.1 response regulator [Bacteroidia bacterium]MBP7728221.1 response regulator [Bacteroidia bacterium]
MIKMLVVDDEPDVEALFTQRFRKEVRDQQVRIHFAFSGEQALQYLRTLDPFDLVLVLSDINMPGMTGLELLGIIRKEFPTLKVMMVTAYGDQSNYDKARELGANDFVTKPVDFADLKARILAMA